MSFYGHVTYSLSDAYNVISFTNAGLQNSSLQPANIKGINEDMAFQPATIKDVLSVATGNKWLYFDKPASSTNLIKVYHSINDYGEGAHPKVAYPYNYTKNRQFSESPTQETNGVYELNWGEVIGVPHIVFDDAGHITEKTSHYFKVPIPQGEQAINDLKTRIAKLEQYATGTHGEDGGGGVIIVTPENGTYEERLTKLNLITNSWPMAGTGSSASNLETLGIGTTLHELMCLVGTRKKIELLNGVTEYAPVNNYMENPLEGTMLHKIVSSYNSSNNAILAVSTVAQKINDMISELKSRNALPSGFEPLNI